MNYVKFTKTGELPITATETSSESDYDFLTGKWKVLNSKLKTRLNNCEEWDEFESTLEMNKILMGLGNRESYAATINGKPFEAIAIRLFSPDTRLWTDYWIDNNNPAMDGHPVAGSFENGIGKFYAKDDFNGKNILVVYQWDHTNPLHPVWSQAYSDDNGKTWEWNWYMTLSRIE